MRHKRSDYMHWAKTQSRARFNLATSGVGAFPLRDLPVDWSLLEIHGDNAYGYPPLVDRIAARHGVDPDCVVEAAGTSMANHLAMATILEPGDEVLIEHPAYGPIVDAARYLEADVKRVHGVHVPFPKDRVAPRSVFPVQCPTRPNHGETTRKGHSAGREEAPADRPGPLLLALRVLPQPDTTEFPSRAIANDGLRESFTTYLRSKPELLRAQI